MEAVAGDWQSRGGEVAEAPPATREQLARVHLPAYLNHIESIAGRSSSLDGDTFTSPESVHVAALAAGAAVGAVDRVLAAEGSRALALVRPPGHHAEAGRAMGFCLYNNVAVAAAHARARGAARVAIIDYDVHHGNGTQHIFETDPSVLYVSAHQFPYYPGTGGATEIGRGAGEGFTVNVPLEIGATDDDYREVFARVIVPVVRAFAPELLLVSAGFDAHERDPLGGMRLTTEAFTAMTQELCELADRHCDGRLVAVTEGGYDLTALAATLDGVVDVLASAPGRKPAWPAASRPSSRGRSAVSQTIAALEGRWPLAT
jgi:acetoin utilization deacetylase AcuC-like enzyme